MKINNKYLKAQALTEFALILPVFILCVMVILDLGRVAFYYSAILNAAREGARHGIVDPNVGNIQVAARNLAPGMGLNPAVTIGEETVQVSVSYQFTPATPFLNLLTGSDQITLISSSTMELEQ